jgi:hypothetical protein
MAGLRITQHGLHAMAARRYGSFAGKTVVIGTDIETWTPIDGGSNEWTAMADGAGSWNPIDGGGSVWTPVDR